MAQQLDLQLKVPKFTGEETRTEVEAWLQLLEACIAKIPDAPQGANAAERAAVARPPRREGRASSDAPRSRNTRHTPRNRLRLAGGRPPARRRAIR